MKIVKEELGPLEDYEASLYRKDSPSDVMLNAELDRLTEQHPGYVVTFVMDTEDGDTCIVHSYCVWAPGTTLFDGEPILRKALERPFAISPETDKAALGDLDEPLILGRSALLVIEQSIRACHPEAKCVTFIVRSMGKSHTVVLGHSIWDVEDFTKTDGCVAQVFYDHPFIVEE